MLILKEPFKTAWANKDPFEERVRFFCFRNQTYFNSVYQALFTPTISDEQVYHFSKTPDG